MKYPRPNPKPEGRNPKEIRNPKSESDDAGDMTTRNPKSEGRNPKEIRNPKSESDDAGDISREDAAFRLWGEEPVTAEMALKDSGPMSPLPPKDLAERTARFAEAVVRFAKKVPQNPANNRLIDQLVGAGTSIGANFCEADDSVSGRDFKNRIGTCRKEPKETMFFLRVIAAAEEGLAPDARLLWREAKELNLIFGSIWRK